MIIDRIEPIALRIPKSPGAAIFQGLIARVNAPLPREAEPAVTFDVEQK